MTEEEEVEIQLSKLTLFIDCYNCEVEKLNKNIKNCNRRACEYKKQDKKQLAMFFISKRIMLEETAQKYSDKSILLLTRRHRIQDLERDRDFYSILKQTNEIIQTHLNSDVIGELRRINVIEQEIEQKNDVLKNMQQQFYSNEIEEDYEELGSKQSEKKVVESMARLAPKIQVGISMLH